MTMLKVGQLRAAPLLLLTLSACASDYGGAINGQRALSPEEQRLQANETKLTEVSRRLNAIEAQQQNATSSDDLRNLRGQLEQLRYDVDQLQKSQAQINDIDQRVRRLEGGGAPPPSGDANAVPGAAYNGGANNSMPGAPIGAPANNAPLVAAGAVVGAAQPVTRTTVVAPAPPAAAPAAASSSAAADEEAIYLRSFDLLKAAKYDDAIGGFKGMLAKYPQGNYADNAWYWMGESYYVKNDYPNALKSYQSLLQKFPASPKVPDALLKSGAILQNQGQKDQARAAFNQILKAYPSSSAATQARTRLAQLK